MSRVVEAVKTGKMDRRTFLAAVGLGFAGTMVRPEFANAFQGIPYRDLAQVGAIHGNPGRWEFLLTEPRRAAKLREDTNFNDSTVFTDFQTVAEGYQLLAEPQGFREQRIVVGPGHAIISEANWVLAKGLLVRRDVSPEELYKFVLSKRTADTVEEHRRFGRSHTVIGIDGLGGKGDMRGAFRPIPYVDGLREVARRYGGSESEYKWVEGFEHFAATFKVDQPSHRLVFLNKDNDTSTTLIGKQLLWSPNSIREQRIVVGPGQNGIFVINATFMRHEGADNFYKFAYAHTQAQSPNMPVIGVNGFRGGER